MDLVRDSEYVWIADEMVRAELPRECQNLPPARCSSRRTLTYSPLSKVLLQYACAAGWAEVAGRDGQLAFLDLSTNTVSEEHPMTGYYRSLFHRHKGAPSTQRPHRKHPACAHHNGAACSPMCV